MKMRKVNEKKKTIGKKIMWKKGERKRKSSRDI